MRLIDADDVGNSMAIKWQKALVEAEIDSTPTIDPETLPIVQELKEQLAKVTAERDAAVDSLENICMYGDPPSDVRPIVHGKWIECFEDWRKQIAGDKCSACGFEHYGTNISHYHFCPNCGADMRGGKR